MFETAHVTNLPPREKGLRTLVTRKWPRGLKREEIDMWVKDLGAPPELLREYRKGKITKAGFQARYMGEVSTPRNRELLDDLQRRHLSGKTIVLVCDSEDETCPVREMLKELLEAT